MLFHKPTKTAFVLPPKTGTTSLVLYLRKLDFKFVPDKDFSISNIKHPFTRDMVDLHPNLANYSLYGFFRDPLSRYVSILRMYKKLGKTLTKEHFASPEQQDEKLPAEILGRQVDWLDYPNMTVLDFEKFNEEVKAFGERYGHSDTPVPKLNASSMAVDVTDDIKQFVRDYYAADYALAKDVLGKEY
jgi:hypothetical protein